MKSNANSESRHFISKTLQTANTELKLSRKIIIFGNKIGDFKLYFENNNRHVKNNYGAWT